METPTLRIVAERPEPWNLFQSRTLLRHLGHLDAVARAANLPAISDYLSVDGDEAAQLDFWSEKAQFLLPVRPPWLYADALFTTLDYLCIVERDSPILDELYRLRDALQWLASENMGFNLVREY